MSSMLTTGAGGDKTSLAAGVYWQSGLITSPPLTGYGWTAGLPGTSTGASVTMLRVQASAARTGCSATCTWKGDITIPNPQQWNGTAWTDVTGPAFSAPLSHGAYTSEAVAATFDSVTTTAFRWAWTESDTSGGNIKAEAFTVS